jgi:hypothetical protein
MHAAKMKLWPFSTFDLDTKVATSKVVNLDHVDSVHSKSIATTTIDFFNRGNIIVILSLVCLMGREPALASVGLTLDAISYTGAIVQTTRLLLDRVVQ